MARDVDAMIAEVAVRNDPDPIGTKDIREAVQNQAVQPREPLMPGYLPHDELGKRHFIPLPHMLLPGRSHPLRPPPRIMDDPHCRRAKKLAEQNNLIAGQCGKPLTGDHDVRMTPRHDLPQLCFDQPGLATPDGSDQSHMAGIFGSRVPDRRNVNTLFEQPDPRRVQRLLQIGRSRLVRPDMKNDLCQIMRPMA